MKRATKAVRGRSKSSSGVPCCSIRPARISTTRSASASASSWAWVTWTKVMPSSRLRRLSSARTRPRRKGSSAESGSSSRSAEGLVTSARASATRCCCPPESWAGRRSANSSMWTSASISRARARRSLFGDAAHAEAEGGVLERGKVREQRVGLEHHRRAAASRRQGGDVRAVEHHVAARRAPRGRRACARWWSFRSRTGRAGSSRSRPGCAGRARPPRPRLPKNLVTAANSTAPRRAGPPVAATAAGGHRWPGALMPRLPTEGLWSIGGGRAAPSVRPGLCRWIGVHRLPRASGRAPANGAMLHEACQSGEGVGPFRGRALCRRRGQCGQDFGRGRCGRYFVP